MTKEELLKKSREENKGRDVADIETSKNGIRLGWIISVVLAAGVAVTDALIFDRLCSEVFFVIMAGLAAVFWYKFAKLHRKHELFVSCCYTVAAAAFFVSWIIQIAG